jgi:Peptidase family M28
MDNNSYQSESQSLTRYLTRICSADQMVRRNELLAILRELDCPFTHSRELVIEGYRPENIVVSFHEELFPRLVIGAHYDSVPGSTGANDNGASVAILLGLLAHLRKFPPKIPLDLAFFDLEEQGQQGSLAYVERTGAERILAVINLDVCGEGDTILYAPRPHIEAGPLSSPVRAVEQSGRFHSRTVDFLPDGDDLSFQQAGLPNISVCILPKDEVELFITAMDTMRDHRPLEIIPKVVETFHNGPRDQIGTVQESAMQTVLRWVQAILEHFHGAFMEFEVQEN